VCDDALACILDYDINPTCPKVPIKNYSSTTTTTTNTNVKSPVQAILYSSLCTTPILAAYRAQLQLLIRSYLLASSMHIHSHTNTHTHTHTNTHTHIGVGYDASVTLHGLCGHIAKRLGDILYTSSSTVSSIHSGSGYWTTLDTSAGTGTSTSSNNANATATATATGTGTARLLLHSHPFLCINDALTDAACNGHPRYVA